jgi:hypothetical protein
MESFVGILFGIIILETAIIIGQYICCLASKQKISVLCVLFKMRFINLLVYYVLVTLVILVILLFIVLIVIWILGWYDETTTPVNFIIGISSGIVSGGVVYFFTELLKRARENDTKKIEGEIKRN